MLNQDDLNKIKKEIEEFFKKATLELEIETEVSGETLNVNLKSEESQILIGEKGRTLAEIQRLLKIVLRKKTESPFFLNLDINDYKKKRIEYLKELAKTVADNVALYKEAKTLEPMLPYERRIIHLEIAEREGITTESVGEEMERRVIIRPD